MAKDYNQICDISPDTGRDANSEANSDFGGDLAGDAGVDLNTGSGDTPSSHKVNKQGIGLKDRSEGAPHSGQRIVDVIPADTLNDQLAGKGYEKPPYTPNTMVFISEADKPITLTQFHAGEESKPNSPWHVDSSDTQGMNADEIKNSLALPCTPDHASDYEFGPGSKMHVGEVNEQKGWGEGGGKQYYIDESGKKDLINTRPLLDNDGSGDDLIIGVSEENNDEGTIGNDNLEETGENLNDSGEVPPMEDSKQTDENSQESKPENTEPPEDNNQTDEILQESESEQSEPEPTESTNDTVPESKPETAEPPVTDTPTDTDNSD
jgi:hypothetical protein